MNFAISMAALMFVIGVYGMVNEDSQVAIASFTISSIWCAADWIARRMYMNRR